MLFDIVRLALHYPIAGMLLSSPAVLALLALVAACIIKAIYNVFFHSLRHFRGPVWATLTPFYLTYLFAIKKSHLKSKELHE